MFNDIVFIFCSVFMQILNTFSYSRYIHGVLVVMALWCLSEEIAWLKCRLVPITELLSLSTQAPPPWQGLSGRGLIRRMAAAPPPPTHIVTLRPDVKVKMASAKTPVCFSGWAAAKKETATIKD